VAAGYDGLDDGLDRALPALAALAALADRLHAALTDRWGHVELAPAPAFRPQ
jgi:hypothetical protein